MRLFLYGTLLRPALLARLAGRSLGIAACRAPGWRRVCLRGTRFPTLRRAPGAIAGGLAVADAAALRRLSAYEGPRYALRRISVVAGRRRCTAHAWIAAAALNRPWP